MFYQVYIILAKPERNVRSAFTTSTVVRMHVGDGKSSSAASRSSSLVNLWKRRGSTGETLRYAAGLVLRFVALSSSGPQRSMFGDPQQTFIHHNMFKINKLDC